MRILVSVDQQKLVYQIKSRGKDAGMNQYIFLENSSIKSVLGSQQ
jgi:hypothetical protein